MIQRQYLPGRMFAAALGSLKQLSEGLIEPALRRLDEVLADEQLLEAVLGRLAQRWPYSPRAARHPGGSSTAALGA